MWYLSKFKLRLKNSNILCIIQSMALRQLRLLRILPILLVEIFMYLYGEVLELNALFTYGVYKPWFYANKLLNVKLLLKNSQ